MLTTILGPVRYLAEMYLNYVVPIRPADAPPANANVAASTGVVICAWGSTNDLDRWNYTIFNGFKSGI